MVYSPLVEAVGVEPTGVSFKDSASNLAAPTFSFQLVASYTLPAILPKRKTKNAGKGRDEMTI